MDRTWLAVALILISGRGMSARIGDWSDWYEDPKVPGIALRQRCDAAAKETQVEIENRTKNVLWWFMGADKLINRYRGSEYDLYPGQTVQFARGTKDCRNLRRWRFHAGVEIVKELGPGEFTSIEKAYRDYFFFDDGKFSIRRLAASTGYSYKSRRTWCHARLPNDTSVGQELRQGSARAGNFSSDGCSPEASRPTVTDSGAHAPEPNESLGVRSAASSNEEGYFPRPDCVRISWWSEMRERGLVYPLTVKNTCNVALYVRLCDWNRGSFSCNDGRLLFGESLFGTWADARHDAPCDLRVFAWAAEGGEAAKRWVQSHRPETSKGCGDDQRAAQPEKPPQ